MAVEGGVTGPGVVLTQAAELIVFGWEGWGGSNPSTFEKAVKNLPPDDLAVVVSAIRQSMADTKGQPKPIRQGATNDAYRTTIKELGYYPDGLPRPARAVAPIGPSDLEPFPFPQGPGDLSPVFGPAVILGVGGATDWNKILGDLAKQGVSRSGVPTDKGVRQMRRARPLPKTGARKLLESSIKLLEKLPKWALPNEELVNLVKVFGKALKGGRAGIYGIAAQVGGEYAIEKVAAIAQAAQDANAVKILGPQDAKAFTKRQLERKGPTTRASKSPKKLEPARPAPPAPPSTANARQTRTIQPPRTVRSRASPIEEVTVKAQRITRPPVGFATPAMMKITPRVNKLAVIQKYANAIGSIGRTYLATRRPSSSSTLSNLLPGSQTSSSTSYFTNLAPASTGTGSGCYTVCRKKSTGRKKRKPARVCVSPSQALKLGIRS